VEVVLAADVVAVVVWTAVAVALELWTAVVVVVELWAGALVVVDEEPPQAVIASAAAIPPTVQRLRALIRWVSGSDREPPARACPKPVITSSSDVPAPPGTQNPRRRRQLDWELITCGVSGHALIGRDASELRDEDGLLARDQGDVRWHRCLRCDCWVALPRPERGTREHPPDRSEIELPLRGKALRDKIVLRLIAVDRVIHFLVLTLLGVAVLVFASDRDSLRAAYYRVLTAIQGGVAGGPVQSSGHVGIVRELDRLFTLRTGTLHTVGIALIAYGLLEGTEAIGLWKSKRWAEYLTFISTSVLLPFEVYELATRPTALKVIGFLINVAVVVYLLLRKRLFGLRGGFAAEEAERRRESGWGAIERATAGAPRSAEPDAVSS
jgi:uncharacterized membrane protein (DUF2068 family)